MYIKSSITINNAAIEAEKLYNQLVLMYSETCDVYSDKQIKHLNIIYSDTLEFLNSNGIGGVRINGVFRFTNKENCVD